MDRHGEWNLSRLDGWIFRATMAEADVARTSNARHRTRHEALERRTPAPWGGGGGTARVVDLHPVADHSHFRGVDLASANAPGLGEPQGDEPARWPARGK